MRASTLLFLGAVAVSAGMAIVAAERGDRPGYGLFKPLTTFIILLGAAFLVLPPQPLYRSLIVLGLALSLAGDALLLSPRRFALGLGAFLLAQLTYLVAFGLRNPVRPAQVVWLLPFVAAGARVAGTVWGAVGRLRLPVLRYLAVAAGMAWRAAMRLGVSSIPHASAVHAMAGAVLFVISDAILAVRRWRRPFRRDHALELAAYWMAQFLIAQSVRM